MAKPEQHASPDSLLGQVQRGRGEGYLRILSTPKRDACQLLVDCICNDPRLDSQIESRAEYYASIAVEVGLDLAPLAKHLREHDDTDETGGWNTPLTVGTLGELAKRSYRDAAGILCDYVAWGQWWDWELDTLTALSDPEIQRKVAGAVEQHFPSDDELEKALAWFFLDEAPWVTLAEQSKRIGKFGNNLRKREGSTSAEGSSSLNLTSLTTRQLLALADNRNCHKLRKVVAQQVTQSDVELLMENISLDGTMPLTQGHTKPARMGDYDTGAASVFGASGGTFIQSGRSCKKRICMGILAILASPNRRARNGMSVCRGISQTFS